MCASVFLVRSADGLVSVSPKRLVFSKTAASNSQCSKLKLKNRDQKTIVVNFVFEIIVFLRCCLFVNLQNLIVHWTFCKISRLNMNQMVYNYCISF